MWNTKHGHPLSHLCWLLLWRLRWLDPWWLQSWHMQWRANTCYGLLLNNLEYRVIQLFTYKDKPADIRGKHIWVGAGSASPSQTTFEASV